MELYVLGFYRDRRKSIEYRKGDVINPGEELAAELLRNSPDNFAKEKPEGWDPEPVEEIKEAEPVKIEDLTVKTMDLIMVSLGMVPFEKKDKKKKIDRIKALEAHFESDVLPDGFEIPQE